MFREAAESLSTAQLPVFLSCPHLAVPTAYTLGSGEGGEFNIQISSREQGLTGEGLDICRKAPINNPERKVSTPSSMKEKWAAFDRRGKTGMLKKN
jgi:hypothetical protein